MTEDGGGDAAGRSRRAALKCLSLAFAALAPACTVRLPILPRRPRTASERRRPSRASEPAMPPNRTSTWPQRSMPGKKPRIARLVMEKLYRRNPREWRKGNFASADVRACEGVRPAAAFSFPSSTMCGAATRSFSASTRLPRRPRRVRVRRGASAEHDLPRSTTARPSSTSPYSLDRRKLYNSARNVEIAAWKLANARNPRGDRLDPVQRNRGRCRE